MNGGKYYMYLLEIFHSFYNWKSFENLLRFDNINTMSLVVVAFYWNTV